MTLTFALNITNRMSRDQSLYQVRQHLHVHTSTLCLKENIPDILPVTQESIVGFS